MVNRWYGLSVAALMTTSESHEWISCRVLVTFMTNSPHVRRITSHAVAPTPTPEITPGFLLSAAHCDWVHNSLFVRKKISQENDWFASTIKTVQWECTPVSSAFVWMVRAQGFFLRDQDRKFRNFTSQTLFWQRNVTAVYHCSILYLP